MAVRRMIAGVNRVLIGIAVVVALAIAGIQYVSQHIETRKRIESEFENTFDGLDWTIGSVRSRPFFSGIHLNDVSLRRKDDPGKLDFLKFPSMTIWLTKDQFAKRTTPAKIEIEGAELTLIRDEKGKWNFQDILKPHESGEQMPTIVLRKSSIDLIDKAYGPTPLLKIREAEVTIVNDPKAIITVDYSGQCPGLGRLVAKARLEKDVGASVTFELNGMQIGHELAGLIARFRPDAAELLEPVGGVAGLKGKLDWKPTNLPQISYDVTLEVNDGKLACPTVPLPFEQITFKAKCKDGEISIEKLTAKAGPTDLTFIVDLDREQNHALLNTELGKWIAVPNFESPDLIRKLEVSATDLVFDQALIDKFPDLAKADKEFRLRGPLDVTYIQRKEHERVIKRAIVKPKGMTAMYQGFKYPIDALRGTVEITLDDDKPKRFEVDLVAEGKGKPVTLKGTIIGGTERDVKLVLTGSNILLDAELIDALPDPYPAFVKSMNPTATGDFTAKLRHDSRIREKHGDGVFDNEFDIDIRTGTMNYVEFPYPMRDISGKLLIRTVPDTATGTARGPGMPVEASKLEVGSVHFKNFKATGSGNCPLKIDGSKLPVPGGGLLRLEIEGGSVPFDGALLKAVGKLKLDQPWRTFDPQGVMNCTIHINLMDRDQPGKPPVEFLPARDLGLKMAFNGPTIRPSFFPYAIRSAAGQVEFKEGTVTISSFRGQHGDSKIQLPKAVIHLPRTGGYHATLTDLDVNPLIADQEFMVALPSGVRKAWQGLELKGQMSLHATEMVISDHELPPQVNPIQVASGTRPETRPATQPAASRPAVSREPKPWVYWDGKLNFRDASFQTGVTWTGAMGQLASKGNYARDRFGAVIANIGIDQATVMKQPLKQFHANMHIHPEKPDLLVIQSMVGNLFKGEIGGEGVVLMGSPLRFNVQINGSRLQLEEFSRVNKLGPKTQLEGLANAQINLQNPIDPRSGQPVLHGVGTIDVPHGRMIELPHILRLIKLVRLRPIDDVGFEEAHAAFRIVGNRIKIGQFDLYGNAVSLGGEGEMNLDGTDSNFEFYTVWTNLRNLPGVNSDLTARLSGMLYKIRVSGDLTGEGPKMTPEPLPAVVEPIRRMMDRIRR